MIKGEQAAKLALLFQMPLLSWLYYCNDLYAALYLFFLSAVQKMYYEQIYKLYGDDSANHVGDGNVAYLCASIRF